MYFSNCRLQFDPLCWYRSNEQRYEAVFPHPNQPSWCLRTWNNNRRKALKYLVLRVSGFQVSWERNPLDNSFLRVFEQARVVRHTFLSLWGKSLWVLGFPGTRNPGWIPLPGTHLTICFCAFLNPLERLDTLLLPFWDKPLWVPGFLGTEIARGSEFPSTKNPI